MFPRVKVVVYGIKWINSTKYTTKTLGVYRSYISLKNCIYENMKVITNMKYLLHLW